MIIIFRKSQLPLFDTPINVAAHVRKDGTVVAPHVRIVKVAQKPAPKQSSLFAEPETPAPVKRTKLDAFIHKHGGERALASVLAGMTEGQQQALLAAMAKLDGSTPEAVAARFDSAAATEPKRGETPDLFAQPVASEPAPTVGRKDVDDTNVADIVEHVTGRGKTLRGIVRTDLTLEQAKEIDPYTFRKDGGYFIREKHVKNTAGLVPSSSQGDVTLTNEGNIESAPVSAEPVKQADLIAAADRKHHNTEPFGVPAGITKGKRREVYR